MNYRMLFLLWLTLLLMMACTIPITGAPPTASIEETEQGEPEALSQPTIEPTEIPAPTEVRMPFELTSTAFAQGEPIPVKYSCDGDDISPPLAWGDPPEGTQTFTLIMDDPDAPVGIWDHWIIIDIPADVRTLPENMLAGMKFGDTSPIYGKNSWGRNDYGGPCPPSGTHRYFFKLYALDTTLNLGEGASKSQVTSTMEGHILAETDLMGTYSR